MQVDNNAIEKIKEAGRRIWEDEKIREKFVDDSGKFDTSKATTEVSDFVKTIHSMSRDIKTGNYMMSDKWKWYIAVAAVGYAISPLDFIPDIIPGVGWSDDAGMIAVAVHLVGSDINKYRKWKFGGNAREFEEEDYTNGEPVVVDEGGYREVTEEKDENSSNSSSLDDALGALNNLGR